MNQNLVEERESPYLTAINFHGTNLNWLPPVSYKSKKAALTELFADAKYSEMPNIVEEIVTDIDQQIVKYIRFKGWYHNSDADKDVRIALLQTLKKYSLQKDKELYAKVYSYIKEYY